MDDLVDTIEEQIRADRRALDRDIQELEGRAQAALDWRRQYREHAGAALAVALGGGVLLGALSRGRTGVVDDAAAAAPRRGSMLSVIDPSGRAGRHVGQLVEDVLDALVGLAGATAIKYIGEAVPGFRQEYEAHSRAQR